MIKEIYENAKAGMMVRQNLSSLRQEIKTQAGLDELFLLVEDDVETMKGFLHHEDAKTRKNAALLMGELEIDEYAALLYEAYCEEEQLFVKAAYLAALKKYDITPFLPALKQRVKELTAQEKTEENRKHIEDEMRALNELLIQSEGISRHEFIGFTRPVECVLLTNKLHAQTVADQVEALFEQNPAMNKEQHAIATFAAGVRVVTSHVAELFELRTFQELCFALPKCRMVPMDPVQAAEEIADAGIVSFLKKSHRGTDAGIFYYRIDLKSQMELSQVSQFTKRFAARLEEKTGRQLINSPSDYEITIRLTENKKGGLNVLLQDHTIADDRFSYRREYMPTSIRPVQAALLVELARDYMIPDAQVLDPFCGVATMLIERQHIVKANTSYAIDIQSEAIEKAKENTAAAGQIIHFVNKDCLQFTHEYSFDEIFTNMPFAIGRVSQEEIEELYEAFFARLSKWLTPQGTIILYTHDREEVLRCAHKNGYRLLQEHLISKREQTYLMILR